MPKSLHHCCRIYCSLDAKITVLVVAENTALLVTVHNNDLDISIDTISAALGHQYGSRVTAVYINPDQKRVDQANRRVIDWVFYGKR